MYAGTSFKIRACYDFCMSAICSRGKFGDYIIDVIVLDQLWTDGEIFL